MAIEKEAFMQKVVVTLDLEGAVSLDYVALNDLLERKWGLIKYSLNKEIPLPANTYMGKTDEKVDISKIRDEIKAYLKHKNNIRVKSFFGGILEDWAMSSKK